MPPCAPLVFHPLDPPDPSAWVQRVGGLVAVPGLLRSLGVAVEPVLAAAGLPAMALDAQSSRIPYAAMLQLLAECAARSRLPHFGLLAGQAWRLQDLGLLGELMRHAPTLGDALRTMVAHQQLNALGGAPVLMEHGHTVELGYVVYHPSPAPLDVVFDTALAAGMELMRALAGPRWCPRRVGLPRAAPADAEPYARHFGCLVRFDAERATLEFAASTMSQAIAGADPQRWRALNAQMRHQGDAQLVPALYRTVRTLLAQGAANRQTTAQQLSLHRRTFNRRLQAQGTGFREILDDVRHVAARQLLRDTALTVIDVAAALGYAEASSFNHAFRRWSGMTPTAWRLAAREDPPAG
jgi:AraC-like DNA-binding protein